MNVKLTDEQWSKIQDFLQTYTRVYIGDEAACRRFGAAALWVLRSRARWRLLSAEYGRWNSLYKRCARWSNKGIWEQMHLHFIEMPDLESLNLNSSVATAQACTARTLHAAINGSNVDIFATASGANQAIARIFTTTANASGQVVIQLTRGGGTNNPKVT